MKGWDHSQWVERVEIEGHALHVRPLSVAATERLLDLRDGLLDLDPRAQGIRLAAYATYLGLCDEQGALVFDIEAPEAAYQLPFAVADACGSRILQISGLEDGDEEGKLEAAHSDD